MTKYYIQAEIDGESQFFALDSTTEATQTLTGSVTSFPLANGDEVSDNYVNRNKVISFSGTITDIKVRSLEDRFRKSTTDFISGVENLKNLKRPFTIYLSGEGTGSSSVFGKIDNCVFESITITQNQTRGGKLGGPQAYAISFTAKQIRFGSRADSSRRRAPVLEGTAEIKKTSSGQKQTSTKTMYRSGDAVISESDYLKLVAIDPQAVAEWEIIAETQGVQ